MVVFCSSACLASTILRSMISVNTPPQQELQFGYHDLHTLFNYIPFKIWPKILTYILDIIMYIKCIYKVSGGGTFF